MDDLQILLKAVIDENSQSSLDSKLAKIAKNLGESHTVKLKVEFDESSVKTAQTQLQAIAKQVSSASRGSANDASKQSLQVFDSAKLKADGQMYFNSVRDIVSRAQKEFSKLGKTDITNVFKDAKGNIQSFTASVTKADGVVEKFNFNLAKIKNGSRALKGFVQSSSVLSDKNVGTNLTSTQKFLSSVETRLKDITSKHLVNAASPIREGTQQYKDYQSALAAVQTRIEAIRKANSTLSQEHKIEINAMVSDLKRYADELMRSANDASKLKAKPFDIQKSEMQAVLDTQIKKWQNAGIFGGDFKTSVEEAKAQLASALNTNDLDAYRHKMALLTEQFRQLKLDGVASGNGLRADTLNANIQTLQKRILNLKQTYSAFVGDPELSARWNELFDESKVISTQQELTNVRAKLRLFEQDLISAEKHQKSWLSTLKDNIAKMGQWMILGGVIAGVMRGINGLYDAVVELDTAMTELKKVTDETDAAYDNFLSDAAQKAVDIGTTYSDYVTATANFARLGYDMGDASSLAEVATIYSVVGDEISSMDEATSSIISTMKAFGIEAGDAMSIVDKFNKIGNEFAISSGGVGDALQRSASAMAAANNTIDESIALIVAANNVVQDPASVGTMWKTVAMRIRGAKTELEEAGLETEYMAESTAKLQKQIKALTNVDGTGGFDIMADSENFKSTYEIILGVSKVWEKMSDIDQAALLELLAGKRQGNALAAAIENMDDAVAAMNASVNSEGSALAEHEKWMESIQAKQQKFQAQYQTFANTLLNSDLIKFAYDAGTGILGFFTDLTNVVGALPPLFAAITPFFDKLQAFKTVKAGSGNGLFGSGETIVSFKKAAQIQLDFDANLLDKYNAGVAGLGTSVDDLTKKQIIWNDTIGRGSDRLKAQVSLTDTATVSSSSYKSAVNGASGATTGLGVSSKIAAVGVGILNTAINAVIGFGIGLLISAIGSLITKLANARQEAIDTANATIEEKNAILEETEALKSAYAEYKKYASITNRTAGEEEALQTAVENVNKILGEKAGVLDGLTAGTDTYTQALDAQIKKELELANTSAKEKRYAAETALQNTAWSGWGGSEISYKIQDKWTDEEYVKAKETAQRIAGDYLREKTTPTGQGNVATELVLEPINWNVDHSNMGAVVDYYYKLIELQQELAKEDNMNNKIYERSKEITDSLTESVNNYVQAKYDELATAYDLNNGTPSDIEEFKKYREYLQSNLGDEFSFDGLNDEIDSYLSGTPVYQEYLKQIIAEESAAKEIGDRMQAIAEALIPPTYKNYEEGTSAHFHELDAWAAKAEEVKEKLRGLSDEDFNVAYNFVVSGDVSSVDELQNAIDALDLTKKMSSKQIDEYRDLVDNYNEVLSEADSLGIDLSKTVYGNIDTNNRQILQWTDESLATYKDAIESWGMTVDELRGSFSTVVGSSEEFDGVEIAFSPMLQTENGAVLLDYNTVSEYIYGLIDKAGENWNSEDLLRLDTEGLEIDGQIVKNLIADIGDTAIETGAAMHFAGNVGAVAEAYDALSEAAEKAGTSVGALQFYFSHAISKYDTTAKNVQASIKSLWNSEDFKDTREDLVKLSTTLDGITADNIKELASDSSELAAILNEDGMNAQFLAYVLQELAEGNDSGTALVTAQALELNDALDGMVARFEKVSDAKAKYDAAMSVEEKDANFKSYAEAFEELNKQFEAGTTNSNAFWAAAEFLFGKDKLSAWGWSDGLDEIYAAMEKNKTVFSDADSAGAGFIERLYQMSEAGQLVNENGEKLLEISKDSDGAYNFDIDPENLDAIAEKMDITTDASLACLEALSMWGDIDFYNLDDVIAVIDKMELSVETLGGKAINVSALTDQLISLGKSDKDIYDVLKRLQELDGVVLLDAEGNVDSLTQSLTNLGLAADDGVTIKVDAEALAPVLSDLQFTKDQAQELITKLGEADGITLTNSQGEVKNLSDALEYLNGLDFATVTSNVDGVAGAVQDMDAEKTDNVVDQFTNIETAAGEAETAVKKVQTAVQHLDGQTAVVTIDTKRKGGILSSIFGYASGTDSAPAGKALVGEEGAELVQSGNQAYLAGTHGAEIVDLNQGDRVYTASETKGILHRSGKQLSGVIPAYKDGTPDYAGRATASGLKVQTDKKGENGTNVKLNADVKATIDNKDLEDQLEDTLKDLEDQLSNIIGNFEHNIFLLEKNDGTPEQIVAIYRKMQETVHAQANKYRSMGLDETSDYIQDLQKKWWDYKDQITEILHNIYQTAVDNHKNTLSLLENQYEMLDNSQTKDAMLDNLYKQLEEQKAIQDAAHQEERRLRDLGVDENDDAVQECINAWHSAEQSIQDISSKIADNILSEFDDLIDRADELNLWKNYDFTKVDVLKQKLKEINRLFSEGVLTLKEYNSLMRETGVEIYNEQKDALTEIIEKTMELVRQEADDQVDALEDQIDKYQKIIELKKESLSTTKDEEDYQTTVAKKVAEIAEKQAKLAQLDRDTSRSSNAEKQKLAQELADLQQELADYQADYAYDSQVDALDKEADAFESTKNDEISYVKSTVDTEEKVYNAAISRINSNWNQLYQDLIAWNKQYGDMIDGEDSITSAWKTAKAAAQEYGDVVSALNGINSEISYAGQQADSKQTQIDHILSQMSANGKGWHTAKTQEEKNRLVKENEDLAEQLSALLGRKVVKVNGVWYLDSANGPRLFHTGLEQGYVGGSAYGSNEVLAVLKKGELVLNEDDIDRTYDVLTNGVDTAVRRMAASGHAASGTLGSVMNNSNTDNSSTDEHIAIENHFTMQNVTKETAKEFAEYYSDYTIGKLMSAAKRKGLKNSFANSMLR